MPRKTFGPTPKKQSDREIRRDNTYFGAGMMDGPPVWPDGAVAKLYNAVAFPRWIQGRFGTSVYRENAIPAMSGRTHYTARKQGNTITMENSTFQQTDVSNYFVWSDGRQDEIIQYLNSTQVRTRDTFDRSTEYDCYLRGKHNGWHFHKETRRVVAQFGTEFYLANDIELSGWTRMITVDAPIKPSNSVSTFDELQEEVIAFNSNGIFKLYTETVTPYYWRMNNNTPSEPVTSNNQTDERPYGRRYLYTAARLTGTATLRTRGDSGVLVQQESGPNTVTAENQDYGVNWTEYKIGNDTRTRGRLEGQTVVNASRDAVGIWSVIIDGTLSLSINGRQHNLWIDFTGVGTMADVAARIQVVMKNYWPDSTCRYSDDDTFVFTSGDVDDTTIDSVGSAGGGTEIQGAGYLNVDGEDPTEEIYACPATITLLRVPLQDNGDPHECYTHFPIYGTADVGVNGTDPVTGAGNDPERYVWLHDLRVCAAFLASKNEDGVVIAHVGYFEQADVGSPLKWEDGDRDTIATYVDSTHVTVSRAPYDEDQKDHKACCIGDGGVCRAYQSGDRVYWLGGDEDFPNWSLTEGSTIHWSTGARSYVRSVLGARLVCVWDSATRNEQGITVKPLYRNFRDTVDDDIIRSRIKYLSMKNRLWEKLPNANIGRVMPGWMFSATRYEKTFRYTQMPLDYFYLAGYYFPGFQYNEDANDAIYSLEEFPNLVVVYCAKSVYSGPTNTSTPVSIPSTGQFINVFNGLQIRDDHIGVLDWGSIKRIDIGKQMVITSEPGVREFDGFKFGPNMAETAEGYELVMRYLRGWKRATASAYKDGELLFWGQKE